MLEQIAAFLTSLAVAAAGLVGLDTAGTASQGVGTPEIAAARAAVAREEAAERLAQALADALATIEEAQAQGGGEDGEVEAAVAGLDTATTAITNSPAWDAGPDGTAADEGLTTALEAIANAPTDGGEGEDAGAEERPDDVPPVTPPTAPPGDVPGGPSGAPGGRP